MTLTRRLFLSTALAAGLLMPATPGLAAPEAEAARSFILETGQNAIDKIANDTLSLEERRANFRELFVAAFDLDSIGRFVMGRYWRAATPEQRERFQELFVDVQALTWAGRFADYKGVGFTVDGTKPDGDDRIFVETSVETKDGPPAKVVWRLRESDDSFKIIDMIVESTSMAITLRSEYASVIQRGDGVQALIDALKKKRGQLKG